ncbi:MAG: peptidoglycan-binding protein [Pseudomonadota bacterium]
MRRAKPILAATAIALSLAACQWMGGDEQQASNRPTGTMGPSGGAPPTTPTAQQYPGMASAQQTQSVSSDFLQRVQKRLGDRGYDVGPIDGVWGDSTQTALRNFQRDQGLRQSGQLDRQTIAALGIQPQGQQAMQEQQQQQRMQPQRQQQPYQPMQQRGQQQGMMQQQSLSPDVVRNIQQSLQDRGYQVGQVDGMWGRQTAQALRNFQQDQDMRASGRIDRQTLAALGIGQQQMGQTPQQGTDLQQRQRMQQDQLGEMPAVEPEAEEGLGLFEPEPDIGPAESPQLGQEPEPDFGPAERPTDQAEPDIGPAE